MGKKQFVLTKKPAICISYKHPRSETSSKIWIIADDLNTWKREIYGRTLLTIDEQAVDRIVQQLDQDSQEILWYCWRNGHATIDELSEVMKALAHMDLLHKIKKVINPTAERTIGSPILTFERSRVDPVTGEKILFGWWLMGKKCLEGREPILDIFDEEDHLTVILELLDVQVQEEEILVRAGDDELTVSARGYHKKFSLPAEVHSEVFTQRCNNNMLQIKLNKTNGSGRDSVHRFSGRRSLP
ncbi:MAG: Hsp20/alpha crystallin family protein [Candidatus Bipolaricaulia bacterium]